MSPVRALLTAKAQSTLNTMHREAGEAGVVAAVLIAGLVLAAMLPPVAGAASLGFRLARELPTLPGAVTQLAVVHTFLLGLGMLGGLLAYEPSFSQGGFRVFPVSRAQLLRAELAAGLLDVLTLLAVASFAALAAGIAWAEPAAAPFAVLLSVEGALSAVVAQQLVGRGRQALLKRVRLGFPALLAGTAAGAVVCVMLLEGRRPAAFSLLARAAVALITWSPAWQGYAGVREALAGEVGGGWARQLLPAALTAAALWAGAWVIARENGGGASARGRTRLWSFRTPASGIGRLLQAEALSRTEGRLLVLLPVFVAAALAVNVVLVRSDRLLERGSLPGPMRLMERLPDLPLVGVFIVLLLGFNRDLWANQFAWDGGGVKLLFALPVSGRDILVGKTLGLLRLYGLQAAAGVLPLAWVRVPSAAELVWGIGMGGTAFLILAAVGHVLSARFPRRRLGSGGTTPLLMILPSVLMANVVAVLFLAHRSFAALGAWAPAPGMVALLAATVLGYRQALPFLAARVDALRERIVEEMS